ncbi:PKD domain protein, partial [Ostertagia ostertagi]
MKRFRLLLFAFAVLFYHPLFAQPLSGTYTVNNTTATGGTNFNSLTDAISALNTNGVVAAGAIFNVSSNQTFLETPPALTASGTAGGYIVFRKNGTGNNPVVKPATPGNVSTSAHGGHGDGVIRIAGGDYIEFNGIDIDTNTAYTTNATKYEYGYYILRGSATDGSKFVTIRNANIKLYPGLLYSAAVYVAVYNATGTSMVPTSTAGRHESITIRKNNISRTYNGILLRGYNHATTPNDLYDHFNLVDSNQIEEIGGAATECFGINTIYQDSVQIVANTIKSQVNGATCNGIRPETGTLAPINNACGASGTNNFIEIAYNNVENCVTSGSIFYGIYQSVPGALVHIANNNIRNDTCTVGSTSMYIMWSIPGAGGVNHIFGNQIYNIVNTGTTGSGTMFPMIFNTGGDTRVYKNNIHDITTNSASGAISIRSNTPNFYMYNNFIHSLYTPNSTGANAILAIDLNSGAANQNVFYNTVYLNATSTSTTSFGAHALYISTSVNADVRNNILINQSVPGPTSGIVSAYRRSNTTLTTYNDSSNNNCLYVGAAPVARQGLLSDGTPVTFTATTTNAGTAPTYQWKKRTANVGISTTTYTDNALVDGDTITVVLTSNATCASPASVTSNRIIQQVRPRPTASITPGPTANICNGQTILLTANAGTGFTYQWQLGGVNIAAATTATYTAATAGNYRVLVSNGICTDTSVVTAVSVVPTPVATVAPAGTVAFCQGGQALLTGPATAPGLTYQWRLNGANIPGATNNTYAATAAGSYRLVLSNGSCTDTSAVVTVTVNPIPTATATATGPVNFCQGGSVILNANTGTGITYQWLRNNTVIAGATTTSYTATTTGTYSVVVTNTATGCKDTSRPAIAVTMSVQPATTLTASGNLTFCEGGNVRLQAATGAGLTYQWRLGVANIPGATSASYTAAATGNYSVVVSNGTCSNTSGDIAVTVSSLPLPVISSVGLPSFCQGGSVTLNTATGVGYTYQWQLNTVDIPGATAAAYSATATGNYTVVVTNGACVATSAPFTVSVTPAPTALITPAGATAFCQGGSVVLNASRGTGYTYQWTNTGVNIPGATNYQYTATTSGDYGVVIFDGTCPGTAPDVTVRVNSFPVAVVTVIGGVDLSTTTFTSYQWYRNGVLIPGATAQNYTAVRDGFYAVVVTDDLGCSSTSAVQHITSLDVAHVGGAQTK